MKVKIVYNACFGGFGLSNKAQQLYAELSGRDFEGFDWEVSREDPFLVRVVESLGAGANGRHADLQIAELDAGQRYRIREYDGAESVETPEDISWSIAGEKK